MTRPDFDEKKNFEEFSRYYWYWEELKSICKEHGLRYTGGKIELNKVIEAYFYGKIIKPEKKKKVSGNKDLKFSLETSLVECGFTFGPRFRFFFEQQTGIKPFKFNVDMVATARKVKETQDYNFTLGDLLDIYYGKKTFEKYDKSALQWNKFLKDFCADEATAIYNPRIKAAASLWKIVRTSDMEKVYKHELLELIKGKK